MTNEEDVLAALDKPTAIYSLQQRLDPSNRSTDAFARPTDANARRWKGEIRYQDRQMVQGINLMGLADTCWTVCCAACARRKSAKRSWPKR
jgi:hypothetical protein